MGRNQARNLTLGMILMAVVWLRFASVQNFALLTYDDLEHIVYNPHITQVDHPDRWRRIWTEPYFDMYVPVTYTLWAVIADQAAPPDQRPLDPLRLAQDPGLARALHRLNLLLHMLNTLLVWRILSLVLKSQHTSYSPWCALAGALLFALHPLQVESVAWIAEGRGLLAASLGLIALLLALKKRSLASTLLLSLGLLAKPSIVVLVPMGWLLLTVATGATADPARPWCPWRRTLISLSPWLVPTLLVLIITSHLQREVMPLWPWWQRPLLAGTALSFYVQKLFWPSPLFADYGLLPQFRTLLDYGAAVLPLGILATLALALTLTLAKTRRPFDPASPTGALSLAAALFVAGLLANLGLVPALYQALSLVADRYVYLAMLGPALGLALLLQAPKSRPARVIAILATGTGLAALAYQTGQILPRWETSETLFEPVAQANPKSFTAPHALGDLKMMGGRLTEAEPYYRRAIAARPDLAQGYASLGNMMLQTGRPAEAQKELEKALSIYGHHHQAMVNLAVSLQRQGDTDGALARYEAALAYGPHPLAYLNKGLIHAARRQWPEAIGAIEASLRYDPRLYQADLRLAEIRATLGQKAASDQSLEAARTKAPHAPEVYESIARIRSAQGLEDEARAARIRAQSLRGGN